MPCKEMATGCANMSWGHCGFDNNNISIYSSDTLGNTGWTLETDDAFPRATREVGRDSTTATPCFSFTTNLATHTTPATCSLAGGALAV